MLCKDSLRLFFVTNDRKRGEAHAFLISIQIGVMWHKRCTENEQHLSIVRPRFLALLIVLNLISLSLSVFGHCWYCACDQYAIFDNEHELQKSLDYDMSTITACRGLHTIDTHILEGFFSFKLVIAYKGNVTHLQDIIDIRAVKLL